MKITVVGAANIDITASPLGRYVPCDSNPSRVEISYGGVGRNIAHNLCLMGEQVRLFTVFGDDAIALSLRDDCRRIGMTIDPILEVAGARSNYFICVNDHNGEMQAGAADMELMMHLTSEMLATYIDSINSGIAIVADCNPSDEVLQYLLEHCTIPLYVDATSTAKAIKIKSLLKVSHNAPLILKVNQAEAVALSGIKGNVEAIGRWFIQQGVSRIYITMGSRGVFCFDGKQCFELPSKPVIVVNTTGAGDAFMAGVVHAELHGATMQEACAIGIEAATLSLQSATAVNPEINRLTISW